MLQKLSIRNYAIIDRLTLEPDPRLNIVTGETGAGKSIILGALSLILGERADVSVLINKEDKCVVEAFFDVKNNTHFRTAIKEEELDDEDQCIIRREITASGKSRAFVNDSPVNLVTLNRLTSLLVDLHQQFDHLAIRNDRFQMDVLDAIGQNKDLKTAYQQYYQQYQKITRLLEEKTSLLAQMQKEADYRRFLLEELQTAGFKENEIEQTEAQMKQMANGERIQQTLQQCYYMLQESELPVVSEVRKINQQLQGITDAMPEAAALQQRVVSVYEELKDIADEIDTLGQVALIDPEQMLYLQERMDLGYKLLKKHGVSSTAMLLEIWSGLEAQQQQSAGLEATIEELQKQLQEIQAKLMEQAKLLSAKRLQTAPALAKDITALLSLVGMPNAVLKIEISENGEPGASGINDVVFLLDANKSGQYLPIYKAASGGEMSRIMLSIKSLTAKAMELPTLIFDEVDTGISGEAARQVGILLQKLSAWHQVICITHQPQVAARADRHLYVYKQQNGDQKVNTNIRVLAPEERVAAIARMIGGEQPSEAALQNARELVAG